jgi:acyl carrier protein
MNDRLAIREFVQNLLHKKGDRVAFSDSELLVARGRLQSIDTLDVLVFLEEKYGIDFGEMGFDQNQVESIDSIVELIGGK